MFLGIFSVRNTLRKKALFLSLRPIGIIKMLWNLRKRADSTSTLILRAPLKSKNCKKPYGLTNDKAPGVDKIRVEMPKAG